MYGGTNAQGPASARLTRLRSRVRSQLPRISYRESGSLFPPSMDLDMVLGPYLYAEFALLFKVLFKFHSYCWLESLTCDVEV